MIRRLRVAKLAAAAVAVARIRLVAREGKESPEKLDGDIGLSGGIHGVQNPKSIQQQLEKAAGELAGAIGFLHNL